MSNLYNILQFACALFVYKVLYNYITFSVLTLYLVRKTNVTNTYMSRRYNIIFKIHNRIHNKYSMTYVISLTFFKQMDYVQGCIHSLSESDEVSVSDSFSAGGGTNGGKTFVK